MPAEMVLVKFGEDSMEVAKAVLTLSSDVFEAMLDGDMKEAHDNTIDFSEESKSEFETLIKFIHPRSFHKQVVQETNLHFLLKWSDKYDIGSVKDRCEDFELNRPVTFSSLLLAHKYNLQRQLKRCVQEVFPQLSPEQQGELVNDRDKFLESLPPHIATSPKCDVTAVQLLAEAAPELVHALFPVLTEKATEQARVLSEVNRLVQTMDSDLPDWHWHSRVNDPEFNQRLRHGYSGAKHLRQKWPEWTRQMNIS